MHQRNVVHDTFVLTRVYPASPARVFAAWATPAAKAQWFAGPEEWGPDEHSLDFRVGGREISRGGPLGGPIHHMEAIYQDIIPNQRIIYTYDMHLDDKRISVSLTTVELLPEGTKTRLILTEQGVYLDGADAPAARKHGTGELLDALGTLLASASA